MPAKYINDRGNDITSEFIDYCAPLLGGPLPEYVRLEQNQGNV